MAESKDNLATEGLSGRVGNLVFRHRKSDGKTFVSRVPTERDEELSPAQKAINSKFQRAVLYGKSVIADPDTKAEYAARAKGGQSAYNVAVSDYFQAPDISTVDMDGYSGQIGDMIRITVTDDFEVAEVQVVIENGDGSLVEQGLAMQDPIMLDWIYTATVLNGDLGGNRVTVIATDRPNNETVNETLLP